MVRHLAASGLLLTIACSVSSKEVTQDEQSVPANEAASVETKRQDVTDELFGVVVSDPYRWLEDEESPDVKAWMAAQDEAARAHLKGLPAREALRSRLEALLYVDTRGAPIERGGRLFYWKKGAKQEKAVHYVKLPDADEKVLIDPNTITGDGSVSIGEVVPSHDGKLVAYTTKSNNADESDLHVMDVDTEEELDLLEGLRYTTPSWTPDGAGFFYTWIPDDPEIPEAERMGYGEVRFHRIGTAPSEDEVFKGKTGDPRRWQWAHVSEDGRYLFLTVAFGWSDMDLYVMDLKAKNREWQDLAVGTKSLYSADAYEGTFYIATNLDAPKWQVFSVDPKRIARKQWRRIIPEREDATIDEMSIVGGHLAVKYLHKASTRLSLFTTRGKKVRDVKLPTVGTASGLIGNQDSDTAYFTFSSFTYPSEVYRTSVKSGETKLFAKTEIPVNPDAYEVEQVFYPSKDGTQVSMFIVHQKGLKLDGDNPTLLYGYGGFNISLTPSFSALIQPWLERGGVYAVPNLRGGGEYGEEWHQAGMGANKQNVFDDFAAAAKYLIAKKYTRKERLAISGRSNGGLLVGATMTQHPELFEAVICGVPLLDMVRYHRFGVGTAWIPEYGSPEVKEEFEVLYAYSPYHHVEEGTHYPALLMLSADTDDRVDPMHARKFHAAIEHAAAGDEPNLLRIEKNSGHGGADLRKAYLEQAVDELSFLLSEIGKPQDGRAQAKR